MHHLYPMMLSLAAIGLVFPYNSDAAIAARNGGGGPPVKLLPYPQTLEQHNGKLALDPARYGTDSALSPTEQVAKD